MQLSRSQKKLWHSVVVGFATGALTSLQFALTSGLTEKKAVVAALFGAIVAGFARVAGAVIAWIDTTDAPAPPAAPAPTDP